MLTCIAIDDEPLALQQICGYINKTTYLNLENSFTNAVSALEYITDHPVDLMFVDIHMPDLSGLEFVKALDSPPKVIFTTAYREYAFEGFRVDAADFLVKPIGYADFLKSTEKVRKRYFNENNKIVSVESNHGYLFIKSEHKIIKINYDDIKYIEGMRDYIRIHLDNQKPVMALMGMKKLTEFLPEKDFMRVHRSYIVNLKKITVVERSRIIFDNTTYIPVSDQYKEEFQKFLDNNFIR